ncbi:MAG: hypothetical protein IJK05_06210 [Bacteroidales bacterium]|nr:hypothetical protein [Bacteroidales bacterium]
MKLRILAFCLGVFSLSAILSSCGRDLEQADALVTIDGQAAGVVLKYTAKIDNTSVSTETYEVENHVVGHLFVSDSNPFKGDQGSGGKGGRYVIILLKERPSADADDDTPIVIDMKTGVPDVHVNVRQVAPVRTMDGKKVKPWRKAVTTVDRYPVDGSPMR